MIRELPFYYQIIQVGLIIEKYSSIFSMTCVPCLLFSNCCTLRFYNTRPPPEIELQITFEFVCVFYWV